MAHFVQEKCLDLVPVWTLVRENKLTSERKLKKMISKLRELEGNLQRQERDLQDLKDLVECTLEICERFEKAIKETGKVNLRKSIIERLLATIGSRFEVSIRRFSTDIEFWRYWIDVYLKLRWFDSVSDVYNKSIRSLGHISPDIWIEASFFPFRHKGKAGIKESFKIIQECLRVRFHSSEVVKVFIGWFQLELQYCAMLAAEQEGTNSNSDLEKRETCVGQIYKSGKAQVGHLPIFYTSLLKLLNTIKVEGSEKLVDKIKSDLECNCAKSDDTYPFLALTHVDPAYGGDYQNLDQIWKCFDVFKKGVELVPSQKIFDVFIATHVKILEHTEKFGPIQRLVRHNLRSVYAQAHDLNFLKCKDYEDWINVLREVQKDSDEDDREVFDAEENWISYSEWLEQNAETPATKLRKADRDANAGSAEALDLESVIDLALVRFPVHAPFVRDKMSLVLGNPAQSAAEFYAERDIAEAILTFLKKHALKLDESEALPIWRDAFLHLVYRSTWSRVPELLILAAPYESIQRKFTEEYLRVLYAKEDHGRKRAKLLKKLVKANGKKLDPKLVEFIREMDELFPSRERRGKGSSSA